MNERGSRWMAMLEIVAVHNGIGGGGGGDEAKGAPGASAPQVLAGPGKWGMLALLASPPAPSHCELCHNMRTVACLIVVVVLMASLSGGNANHGRIGIHSALDGRWPDLVGRDAEEAKTHILSERPYLNVRIVPTDMMVTMDYNENRVRLFVDDERKVVKCPTIG
ncbi:uncharacterized protein [Physcomitrium patens]